MLLLKCECTIFRPFKKMLKHKFSLFLFFIFNVTKPINHFQLFFVAKKFPQNWEAKNVKYLDHCLVFLSPHLFFNYILYMLIVFFMLLFTLRSCVSKKHYTSFLYICLCHFTALLCHFFRICVQVLNFHHYRAIYFFLIYSRS